MSTTYNNYYKKQNYFGNPYPGLVEFFETYTNKTTVLDLGCGQGRDSLFLGRLGYRVTGVDLSSVGIKQLNEAALIEGLKVEGMVGDIYTFDITEEYDMILLDSILHFYKNDLIKERRLLEKIIKDMKPGGVLCNFMQKGSKREKIYKDIIDESGIEFKILLEDYTEYPEYGARFHMYIIKKLKDLKFR